MYMFTYMHVCICVYMCMCVMQLIESSFVVFHLFLNYVTKNANVSIAQFHSTTLKTKLEQIAGK